MKKGWISLHRQIQDCWIWNDEPFSKGQAWVDLLLSANHEDKKIYFNGELRTINKGQMLTSIVKLSNRWQWSRGKTRRFLDVLESDGMVTLECNRGGASNGTLLTIEKYEVYQYSGTTDESTDDTTHSTTVGQRTVQRSDINNNDNNENNVNNENNNIPRSVKHKYGEYNHVLLTDSERDKLFDEYGTSESLEAISFLDEYIEMKGYKAKNHYLCIKKWVFDALKRQNGQTRTSKPQERDLIQELMNA